MATAWQKLYLVPHCSGTQALFSCFGVKDLIWPILFNGFLAEWEQFSAANFHKLNAFPRGVEGGGCIFNPVAFEWEHQKHLVSGAIFGCPIYSGVLKRGGAKNARGVRRFGWRMMAVSTVGWGDEDEPMNEGQTVRESLGGAERERWEMLRRKNNDKGMMEVWVMFTHRSGRVGKMRLSPEAEQDWRVTRWKGVKLRDIDVRRGDRVEERQLGEKDGASGSEK